MNKYFFNQNGIAKVTSIIGLALVGQLLNINNAQAGTALTSQTRFEGKVDYEVTGGSLRKDPDSVNYCSLKTSSTAELKNIPANATIEKAYLYWTGSGANADLNVTLNNNNLTADRHYTETSTIHANALFFQGVKDVTNIVNTARNGNYTLTNLNVDNGATYCDNQVVLSAWSLIVVYQNPDIPSNKLNTIELYEGLQASRNSSFDYTLSGIKVSAAPNAKFTMLAWEGDEKYNNNEYFKFNGTELFDAYNPANNVFNSSINSLGQGSNTTYGVDFDTFDVSSKVTQGQNSITAQISTGTDVVLQGAAVMMVTDDFAGENVASQTVAVD
jgi:hypothetical protein